jgi:uncharacterized membrane protein
VRWQETSREKLGNIVSTLLIVVGITGLIIYALYLENPNNIALHYTLIAFMILGIFLALTLAALYFTRGVEHQGGIEWLRTWLNSF